MEKQVTDVFTSVYDGENAYDFKRTILRCLNKFLYDMCGEYERGMLDRSLKYQKTRNEESCVKYTTILGKKKIKNPLTGYRVKVGGKVFLQLLRDGIITC